MVGSRLNRCRRVDKPVPREVPQQHIADRVAPVEQQGTQCIGVTPMPNVRGQAQAGRVLTRIGAPQKTLGTHVG